MLVSRGTGGGGGVGVGYCSGQGWTGGVEPLSGPRDLTYSPRSSCTSRNVTA